MKLVDYTTQDPLQEIKNIFLSYKYSLDLGQIVLFGSRARRDHTQRSDYDIGYTGSNLDFAIYTEIRAKLHQLPRRIDFVDFTYTDPVFTSIASQDTIPLFEKIGEKKCREI